MQKQECSAHEHPVRPFQQTCSAQHGGCVQQQGQDQDGAAAEGGRQQRHSPDEQGAAFAEVLLAKWNLSVLQNIAASEETHYGAIGALLARYGVTDPAQSGAGAYTDPKLNALCNELLSKGMQSAQAALEVGVLVEKQDISDLESALKSTTKYDIKRVFSNLMNGSYNHLEAFETVCTITVPAN